MFIVRCCSFVFALTFGVVAHSAEKPANTQASASVKPLNAEERTAFLSRRIMGTMLSGTFESFSKYAQGTSSVLITTKDDTVMKASVRSPFIEGYDPTWGETFDAIARMTRSTWSYDAGSNAWSFIRPGTPPPFTVKAASNWTQEDRGTYLYNKPAIAPVGLDVYYMGTYSFEKDAEKNGRRIRDAVALKFASGFNKDVEVSDMKKVNIDGAEALYFEANTPKAGMKWRQWVFVKGGLALAAVSALKAEDEAALLPDIEAMLKSLRVTR